MESDIKIGAAAAALGVTPDTLRRWEKQGRVKFVRRGGQRYMKATDLVKLVNDRRPAGASSARNRMHGIVVEVKRDGVMAQVDMICGEYRVVSLMSREAADELGLEPGSAVAAVVKATNVVVEVPQ